MRAENGNLSKRGSGGQRKGINCLSCISYRELLCFFPSQTQVAPMCDSLYISFDSVFPYRMAYELLKWHFQSLSSCMTTRIKHKMKHSSISLRKCRLQHHANKSLIEPFGIKRNKFVFSHLLLLISYTTAEA